MTTKKRTLWQRAERHAKDRNYLPGTDEYFAFIAGACYGYQTAQRDALRKAP